MSDVYRTCAQISDEEYLAALTTTAQHQQDIYVALGGDPNSPDYAYLSYKTKRLREKGHKIGSSKSKGVWLEEGAAAA